MYDFVLEWVMQQGPAIGILALIAWRLERQLSSCVEFTQDLLETLVEQTQTQE